ncbi:MAG: hypothetical protein MRJ65_09910 [Candidatus Brocadiaceae bacterium]|nr:hypothetical protein [Candidatus Brocadiaceae bacterium]
MGIWKRKKKRKEEDSQEGVLEESKNEEVSVNAVTVVETPETTEPPEQMEPVSGEPKLFEDKNNIQEDLSSGVILRGKKISGFWGKGFWGILSIMVLPPVLMFGMGILAIIFALIFPLLAIVLIALIPVVFVTLSVFIVAIPVFLPLLVLFLLITGKGRLLIGSEDRWFGIEMLGKRYSIK